MHTRILEGEKERIQIFNGVVIARSGSGTREMFVVRRIVEGEGVERKFPLHSPKIAKIEVKRSGIVRRAKLYFLRDRVGKAVRRSRRKGRTARNDPTLVDLASRRPVDLASRRPDAPSSGRYDRAARWWQHGREAPQAVGVQDRRAGRGAGSAGSWT